MYWTFKDKLNGKMNLCAGVWGVNLAFRRKQVMWLLALDSGGLRELS